MTHREDMQFAALNLSILAVTGFIFVWLSVDGTIDFAVSRLFFDPVAGVFPLKGAPLFAVVGHTGLKWLVLSIWLCAAIAAASGARVESIREWRSPLLFFCITVALTTLLSALLKMGSAHSCPWDIRGFGGSAQWFPLFAGPASPAGPGHCWPGRHAGGGFALLAGYFAFRGRRPAVARIALAAALGLGALMSFVQIARGAHFLSHNLWSLWIAWFCSLTAFLIWRRLQVRPGPASGDPGVARF